jgi:hypothetical protein
MRPDAISRQTLDDKVPSSLFKLPYYNIEYSCMSKEDLQV